mgnify:CR=1 FL=1
MNNYRDIIIAPVITERSALLEQEGKYVFKVANKANKTEVRQAIEKKFNVKVEKVNTVTQAGKVKRFRGYEGVRSDYKKAVITLAEGQNIDVTTGI